jgi:hypothetical protein
MKLLLIIVDDAHKEEVEVFLQQSGVPGYTEISHALGAGATGPRLGSRAFPKTSALILSFLEDGDVASLRTRIADFCKSCGERVRMAVLPVEEMLGEKL